MPGPGYFPFGAGVLLGVIGLSLLVKALFRESLKRIPVVSTNPPGPLKWQNIILTLAGMLVYIFLLSWLGFVLCTFLLMVYFVWIVGKQRWAVSLIASLSVTMASYLLFEVLLDAGLPKGILGVYF